MIQVNSLVDKIAADLQEQIARGKLKPGDRLPSERSLCTLFGVGRTTVREGLKTLVVRGLVTRQGRAVIVADPELVPFANADLAGLAAQTSIRQLFEVRKLMEVRVAGWAALRATVDDLNAMKRAIEADLKRDASGGNPSRMFHDALARAAHNPALIQVYESGRSLFFRLPFYWKLFDDAKVKSVRAARHELARRWHEQILRAIAEHDAAEAEGAMFQHLDIMEKDLLNRLESSDGDAAQRNSYSHPLLASFSVEKPDDPAVLRSRR
ncbi:MAG TPA: FadR/GntR family transcriptional regulator [Candidatus Binatia bacterium]|jgi:GntR family transcriptional repressor for pyruvate dehydrogenase complex